MSIETNMFFLCVRVFWRVLRPRFLLGPVPLLGPSCVCVCVCVCVLCVCFGVCFGRGSSWDPCLFWARRVCVCLCVRVFVCVFSLCVCLALARGQGSVWDPCRSSRGLLFGAC
jgi:hypothetical protein